MPSPRPMYEIYVHSRRLEGHPPARRQGRARRHPLERPPRRLPHRSPGPHEDPDGEERDHRARGGQGRIRAQGRRARASRPRRLPRRPLPRVRLRPPRRDRQHRGRQGHPSAGGGAPRRRRSLPGGGGGQGHGPPQRHRQQRLRPVRLLAGRRLRLRRQRGLRPQEGRHHRARGLGVRARALPQPRPRRAEADPFTVAGHRRHGGRRVRQRDAAQRVDAAGGRLQPRATSSSTPSRTPPRSFRERERLFQLPRSSWRDYDARAHQQGRRHLRPLGQVHPPLRRRCAGCSTSRRRRPAARRSSAASSPRASTSSTTAASAPT